MKLELHILQNFAPSNLNRDDTGAPKDCDFGGTRRARISSQCLKRAVRSAFTLGDRFDESELAARTKRLVDQVASDLKTRYGRDEDQSRTLAQLALEGAGLGIKDERKTEYLLFLPRRHVEGLAALVHEGWDALAALSSAHAKKGDEEANGKKGKGRKKDAEAGFPKELKARVEDLLKDASKTPDLALFGRMIADKPDWNVDAACQVAHAISSNRVNMDFDFYTAVDDFRPEDTAGSDMMGTVQFNSSCFYRYAVVDVDELVKNLDADRELVRRTIRAFIEASVEAVPTGKQNSMAAQNPPSYVLAVVRNRGVPVSLANAFVKAVRPMNDGDLVAGSISALEAYFAELCRMYGTDGITASVTCADRELPAAPAGTPIARKVSVTELVSAALAQVEA